MKAVVSVVNKSRWILWIYAGGFLLGAAKHGYEILRGGLLPYTNAPFAFNLYWTSLLALDLLVVVLVPLRPRWGALLAVAVMISDMVVDLYAAGVFWHQKILTNIGLYGILTFGLFVLITAPRVWKQGSNQSHPA
jgi:hypothetical protein